MKQLIITTLVIGLTISCQRKGDFSKVKPVDLTEASKKFWDEYREKRMKQYESLGTETHLSLLLIDFCFDERNRKTVYKIYNEPDPYKIKGILLEDENFVKQCKSRGISLDDIPDGMKLNRKLPRISKNN